MSSKINDPLIKELHEVSLQGRCYQLCLCEADNFALGLRHLDEGGDRCLDDDEQLCDGSFAEERTRGRLKIDENMDTELRMNLPRALRPSTASPL